MIRHVTSSLRTFKSMEFRRGLNVVVAEKHEGATERDTRNSAGKTSFVEVIHFLLGAEPSKHSMFVHPPLASEAFTMTFDLGGTPCTVTRSAQDLHRVHVQWVPPPRWRGSRLALGDAIPYTIKDWTRLLGEVTFGLRAEDVGDFGPSYRMLLGYFARREREGGFHEWQSHHAKTQPWQEHVALSYLLGFDWEAARRLHRNHKLENEVSALRKQAKGVTFGDLLGEPARVRAELAIKSADVERLARQLDGFRVHVEYEQLEAEANTLTQEIQRLSDETLLERQLLGDLTTAQTTERTPRLDDLRRSYRDAGVSLPGIALRRFEEVQAFHESVVQNRQRHLAEQILDVQKRIDINAAKKAQLDERRAVVVSILRSHGALATRDAMAEELARLRSERDDLERRAGFADQLARKKDEAESQRHELQRLWREDVREHREVANRVAVTYEEISRMLFEHHGRFEVHEDLGKRGRTMPFELFQSGDRGRGIRSMQLFCFDMTLAVLGAQSGRSPGFLIHDSHAFSDADQRQIGLALHAGSALAERHGFQYIVTLNTDVLESAYRPPGFDLDAYVNPQRLNDDRENGGLFGVRFERRIKP